MCLQFHISKALEPVSPLSLSLTYGKGCIRCKRKLGGGMGLNVNKHSGEIRELLTLHRKLEYIFCLDTILLTYNLQDCILLLLVFIAGMFA